MGDSSEDGFELNEAGSDSSSCSEELPDIDELPQELHLSPSLSDSGLGSPSVSEVHVNGDEVVTMRSPAVADANTVDSVDATERSSSPNRLNRNSSESEFELPDINEISQQRSVIKNDHDITGVLTSTSSPVSKFAEMSEMTADVNSLKCATTLKITAALEVHTENSDLAEDATCAVPNDTDSDSDMDADFVKLSRSSRGTGSGEASTSLGQPAQVPEVTLSDEEEDGNSTNADERTAYTESRYGLRKRGSRVSYADIEGHSDCEDFPKKQKLSAKDKDQLEVLSLSDQTLQRYIKNPSLSEKFTKWTIVLSSTEIPVERLNLILQFVKKCGNQAERLFYFKPSSVDFNNNLKCILETLPLLLKFHYQYENREDIVQTIKIISACRSKGHLKSLNSLKLLSSKGNGILKEADFQAVIETGIKFEHLELGDALWEDIKPSTLETFLGIQKSTLETLIIHGGFKGETNKSRFVVQFPKMPNLSSLVICPKYGFISEIKNPLSKKARIVRLDKTVEEPFRFAIQFTSDLPLLKKLVLGNLIEIEDLSFSLLRKLKVFRCGSNWNLSIRFPPEGSRQALKGSDVTDLQLPDALKDPSFIPKVAAHFPNVKKVWMFLPSVPVLRAFFKTMENSELEELYLKTQFDFESTMESCLLPNDSEALARSSLTESQVKTLKEYKHFDDYVRYHNVEMPLEQGDLMEGNSAGIRTLKSLKALELQHIPRILLIPNPEEERKWFDFNCKFLNETFGYEKYPFSAKCHREIMKMNLDRYNWKNLEISYLTNRTFSRAGYVVVSDGGVMDQHSNIIEDDLFTPVQRPGGGGSRINQSIQPNVAVAIQPSMLLPEYFKNKEEN